MRRGAAGRGGDRAAEDLGPEERTPPARPRLELAPTPLPLPAAQTQTQRQVPMLLSGLQKNEGDRMGEVVRRLAAMKAAEGAEEDQEGVTLRHELDAKILELEQELLGDVAADSSLAASLSPPALAAAEPAARMGWGRGASVSVEAAAPDQRSSRRPGQAMAETEAERLRRLSAIEEGVRSASTAATAVGRVGASGLKKWTGAARGASGRGAPGAAGPGGEGRPGVGAIAREDDASAIAELERELEAELEWGEREVKERVERAKASALGGAVPVGVQSLRAWRVDALYLHRLEAEVAEIESGVKALHQRRAMRAGSVATGTLLSPDEAARLVEEDVAAAAARAAAAKAAAARAEEEPVDEEEKEGELGAGGELPSPGVARRSIQMLELKGGRLGPGVPAWDSWESSPLEERRGDTGEVGVDAMEFPESSRLSAEEEAEALASARRRAKWRLIGTAAVTTFRKKAAHQSQVTCRSELEALKIYDKVHHALVVKRQKRFVEDAAAVAKTAHVDKAMLEAARRSADPTLTQLVHNVAEVESKIHTQVGWERSRLTNFKAFVANRHTLSSKKLNDVPIARTAAVS